MGALTTNAAIRETRALLKRLGFKVVRVEKSKHVRIHCEPEFVFVLPTSASDWRAAKNFEAFARRTARAMGLTQGD